MQYKPAKLKGVWPNKFVEYYYRNPANDQWKRFKVYEEINRNKSVVYDHLLLSAVNDFLKKGYNPFTVVDPYRQLKAADVYTAQRALRFFLKEWRERGVDKASLKKYVQSVELLENSLIKKGIQFMPAMELSSKHVEECLRDAKIKNKWSNRTFNNYKGFLSTCFNYLIKKKIITDNPCLDIAAQKSVSKKHKYYDTETLKKLMKTMQEQDPNLHFACQVVYHLCVRSEKELQHLTVGNIFPDRMQVLIEVGKGKMQRYIPMNEQILKIFKDKGVLKLPKDYYVFSPTGAPGPVKFGDGYFSKRFRKIREAMGLSQEHTVYAMKHTRIIHLKKDGASDAEIMSLTGHKDFQSYAGYLRDLGADVNPENIHKLSRSI